MSGDGTPSAPLALEQLDLLWDYDDPAASEERFRALLPRARTERDGALLAELLTQLARAQGLQRRFDLAERTLDEAEQALHGGDARGRIRLLLERGRVENSRGDAGRGGASFLTAWESAQVAGEDALAVDAAHMLGIVEEPEAGLAWNERAMALARSSPDPLARRWVGSLASNMGWARHAAGDDDGAIVLFELARDEWLSDGRDGRARIARWSIARCLRSRGDVDEALRSQQLLLDELDGLGETDGYVLEELGECLLALDRADEARPYLARAWSLLANDAGLRADEPERLARLRALGLGEDAQTEP